MKHLARILLALAAILSAAPAYAISNFQHIVIVVQENRTPDNLFMGMCLGFGGTAQCSTTDTNQYDIQTQNWLDKKRRGGTIRPQVLPLGNNYDPGHTHSDFLRMCDSSRVTGGPCRMDGAADVGCKGIGCTHPTQFPFYYVKPSDVASYFILAQSYGWENHFYQTNQGPSFPAHQFLFGATSAPSATDDAEGNFVSENIICDPKDDGDPHVKGRGCSNGCIAPPLATIQLIDKNGVENPDDKVDPCMEHQTISDLLEASSLTWNYYAPSEGMLWTAPVAIKHICGGEWRGGHCPPGSDFVNHFRQLAETTLISDVAQCALPAVSWVIPTGQDSDHAGSPNNVDGPDWVAIVVNAIGGSNCRDGGGTYWQDTAVVITWDDWGGWYDHEPPPILASPEGGYQLGFRVPMIFVSAYTPQGYIDGTFSADFGTIANFVENNFGIAEGSLGFADARAYRRLFPQDLRQFYNLNNAPRQFVQVPARKDAKWFLNDKSPPTPPDDD
ncbi:MAG TPA: alkaline phosphatase family protein [Rhizomicrobium sp.]|nr:alkaline phosphatase family protein [Rhizomicrobium sp.]